MRLTFGIWFTCLIGVCIIQICFAALPPNGAHEFDDYTAQEQQAVVPNAGKSSSHGNRVVNRAIRGPQVFPTAPRSNAQLKSQTLSQKSTTTTTPPPDQPEAEAEGEEEVNNVQQKFDAENDSNQPEEEEVVSSSTPSSTEPTKKSTFVRPFRSNEDFFKRLKERRLLQQQRGYTVAPPTSTSTTSEKPQQQAKPNIRKNGIQASKGSNSADQSGNGSQKKSSSTLPINRRYSAKTTSSTLTTPTSFPNEAIVEESNPVTQTTRSRLYPRHKKIIS